MASTDDELLEAAAAGKGLDNEYWPDLLKSLLLRIEDIVHDKFSIPKPPQDNEVAEPPAEPASSGDAPLPPSTPPLPVSQDISMTSANETGSSNGTRALPPPLSSLLASIITTLSEKFTDAPPYTIQRLAELILQPRRHYRSLAAYLRALDRVVSVSSRADKFPLPSLATGPPEGGMINGLASGTGVTGGEEGRLGSDESLGGALLTPIPWLRGDTSGEVRTERTEIVDGPNGAGGVETVSIFMPGGVSNTSPSAQLGESIREAGAVTQGELLRQEQQAGVVPVAQTQAVNMGRQSRGSPGVASPEEEEEETVDEGVEERPHARGPENVGVEDMGLQDHNGGGGPGSTSTEASTGSFDVETALGRGGHREDRKEGLSTTQAREYEEQGKVQTMETEEKGNDSADLELVDADGKAEEDEEMGDSGEQKGPDSIDSTSL